MVSSFLELLEIEYADQLDEEGFEYVEYAVNGAKRLEEMIDGLLRLSKLTREKPKRQRVDMERLVEDVQKDLAPLVREKSGTIEVDELFEVIGDEEQLRQLVNNLVKNGLVHGGDQPVVTVSSRRTDEGITFSVADSGPGISEQYHDRIFDVFSKRQRDSEGSGIGLAVCKRVVDAHGGRIWVESDPKIQTAFHFTIPTRAQS